MTEERLMDDGQTPLNPSYREIARLSHMLAEAGIPHALFRLYDGWAIHYPTRGNCECSVIEHSGSYGHTHDLLEIMGLLTDAEKALIGDVTGWLPATVVFDRIREHWLRGLRDGQD